jgi:integrating conjugative element protein (TIGR03757 family)
MSDRRVCHPIRLRKTRILWMIVLLVSSLFVAARADIEVVKTIEVFVSQQTPIRNVEGFQSTLIRQGVTLTVYNLDAPAQLSQSLSQNLPNNAASAKKILQDRLHQQGSMSLQQQFQIAYQGLAKSLTYQLDRFPAIVFNHGQAVIYGVTDLQDALALYQRGSAAP